jgi:Leucine-rich repeat (LRR) protein
LPYLNGELPPGLPQDVVDDVVESLIQHSALNATTLRVLKNCELGQLSLAGCRGVTDAWLEPLRSPAIAHHHHAATSSSSQPIQYRFEDIEHMDLDEIQDDDDDEKPRDIFYGSFPVANAHAFSPYSSEASSSSFVSAATNVDDLFMEGEQDHQEQQDAEDTKYSPVLRSVSFASSVTSNMKVLDIRGSQKLTDRGLLNLANLTVLEVAKLDHCHSLTGRGLLALANSLRLRTLSMAHCRRITDEAVVNISHILSLENLSLDGCRCITDRSLSAISELYGLRKLDLSQCDLITDEGLEELDTLESLEELSLGWCRLITDAGIKNLTEHPEREHTLRILRLARCSITDEGVVDLGKLKALEELDLNGCSAIGSPALGDTLEKLKKLTTLDVSFCPGIL